MPRPRRDATDGGPPPKRQRLEGDDDDPTTWTVAMLKEFLKANRMPTTGKKAELVDRVLNAEWSVVPSDDDLMEEEEEEEEYKEDEDLEDEEEEINVVVETPRVPKKEVDLSPEQEALVHALLNCASVQEAYHFWNNREPSLDIYRGLDAKQRLRCAWFQLGTRYDWEDWNSHHPESLLGTFCIAGNFESVKLLVTLGGRGIFEESNNEGLNLAIAKQHIELVRWLIDQGHNLSSYVTPLHSACRANSFEIVQMLLQKGVRVDGEENEKNDYPIAKTTNLDIIKALVGIGGMLQVFKESTVPECAIYTAIDEKREDILTFYAQKMEETGFKWDHNHTGGQLCEDIEIADESGIGAETRAQFLIALAKTGFFVDDESFESYVESWGLQLSQLSEVAFLFPGLPFPVPAPLQVPPPPFVKNPQ